MPEKHLKKYFGFAGFRAGQQQAVESILDGQDTLVVMPTGSGKSLCYQLPALMLPGLTLVVSPLIALMKDQVDFLQSKSLAATFVNSSVPIAEQNKRLQQVVSGKIKILFIAPERFRITTFQHILEKLSVSLIAIDEAHCISLWGHDFRPDYLLLKDIIEQLGHPTVAALTATATRRVQKDIVARLGLKKVQSVVTGFNRPNLTFRVFHTYADEHKFDQLRRLISPKIGSSIVYAGTRKQAEEVALYINRELKVRAAHYHAGLSDRQRTDTQNRFMKNQIQVIVATNAFGMGVDKPDIRLVLHYAVPGTLEAYYQEAGRAGRDGKRSGCILLFDPRDQSLQEWFIENDAPGYEDLKSLYKVVENWSRDGRASVRVSELQDVLDFNDIMIRVGLRYLESSGALERVGEYMGKMELRVLPLKLKKLRETARLIEERRQHKYSMLDQMIEYADTTRCRRQVILDHFGDSSKPEAMVCCDNCERVAAPEKKSGSGKPRAKKGMSLTQAILWVVANHWCHIGVTKLAQILGGSKAHSIIHFGHNRNDLYGAFSDFQISDIEQVIKQLIRMDFLQRVWEGEYIVLDLTKNGRKALDGQVRAPAIEPAKKQTLPSWEITFNFYQQGLKPEQIAERRQLAVSTVYTHLAQAVQDGHIAVTDLVSEKLVRHIRSAIARVGVDRLTPIKEILPASVTYEQIRLVVADEVRARNQSWEKNR